MTTTGWRRRKRMVSSPDDRYHAVSSSYLWRREAERINEMARLFRPSGWRTPSSRQPFRNFGRVSTCRQAAARTDQGERRGRRTGCLLQRWVRTVYGQWRGGGKLMLWRRQLYKIKAILMTRSGIIKRRNALRFEWTLKQGQDKRTNGRMQQMEQNNKQTFHSNPL